MNKFNIGDKVVSSIFKNVGVVICDELFHRNRSESEAFPNYVYDKDYPIIVVTDKHEEYHFSNEGVLNHNSKNVILRKWKCEEFKIDDKVCSCKFNGIGEVIANRKYHEDRAQNLMYYSYNREYPVTVRANGEDYWFDEEGFFFIRYDNYRENFSYKLRKVSPSLAGKN